MAKYFFSNKAIDDLSKIWDYTYENWSEKQADKYYESLISFCEQLSRDPDLGKNYAEIDTSIFGFKSGQHIIFYKISKPGEILVVRILHGKMDLKSRMTE